MARVDGRSSAGQESGRRRRRSHRQSRAASAHLSKVVRAAIENVLRKQVVARSEHGQQRGRDRGHAAGCDKRRLALSSAASFPWTAVCVGVLLSRMYLRS